MIFPIKGGRTSRFSLHSPVLSMLPVTHALSGRVHSAVTPLPTCFYMCTVQCFPNSMSMITVIHLYSISLSLQCSNTVTDMFLHAYSAPNPMLCLYAHTSTRIPTFIGDGLRFILSIFVFVWFVIALW
jgi:hypothetical protein